MCKCHNVNFSREFGNTLMTGGANASYSTEVTERVRAGPVTGSGVRMQFKPTVSKNVNYDNPLEKNVSHI